MFINIAEVTSSNKAPPAPFKESALSRTAIAFNFERAFAISSAGNGLNTLTFRTPALMPCSRNLSQVAFAVPWDALHLVRYEAYNRNY